MTGTAADVVLAAAVASLTLMLGAGLYQMLIFVPKWRQPEGIVAYRVLIRGRHDGHFYQVLAPFTIATATAALVLRLIVGADRVLAGCLLAGIVLAEALTLGYFLPPNRQLFLDPVEAAPGELSRGLVRRWERANMLRLAVMVAGAAAGFAALVSPG